MVSWESPGPNGHVEHNGRAAQGGGSSSFPSVVWQVLDIHRGPDLLLDPGKNFAASGGIRQANGVTFRHVRQRLWSHLAASGRVNTTLPE